MKRREGNEAATAASPVVASPPAAAGAESEWSRGEESERADGLLRGAERFDQGKQHRRRAGAAAPHELPHARLRRARGGREEGGDNINSADDKMMQGVFSLAEMNMARIAERRGGIRGFGKSIRGGNIEQDQCLFMFVRKMIGRGGRLYYSSPRLLSARLKCECGQKGNESPRRPTPKCRERGASYKTQLSEEPPGFLPSKAVFAARRRGSRGDRQRTGKQACKPLFICT